MTGLVIEHLRHAAAEADDPAGRLQKLLRRIPVHPQGEVGLGQQKVGLGLEEQVAQFVGRVGTVFFLPPMATLKPMGKPAKYLALLELRR